MRILLTQPKHNYTQTYAEAPSNALLILGTLAKQAGHDVRITHCDIEQENISDQLSNFAPDIVGITCNTFQVKHAKEIASEAHSRGIKVVIGGVHAPYLDSVNGYKVISGEGETDWLKILGNGRIISTLDDVPIPDYSLVDYDRFVGIGPVGAPPSAAIMASRGCPFQCTYCDTPVVWGKRVRYRRPELVLDEITVLHNDYGINEVFFQDDTFNLNHEWAGRIFQGIIDAGLNNEMLFKICCRVNEKLVTKEYLELAARAGVWNIFYGIESGSQMMLDRMRKGITIAEIERAVRMTHEVGINTQCSFIVGLPGESLKTLRETDALIRRIEPTKYGWCYFCPFPGTAATAEAMAKGHVLHTDYEKYGYGLVLCRTDELDYDELEAFRGFNYE